jgi:hypothetical protein
VADDAALELVRKDKLSEVQVGHDRTYASHHGLIPSYGDFQKKTSYRRLEESKRTESLWLNTGMEFSIWQHG